MCLLLFSYRQHPQYPLVLAANRDEFYPRPTAPAAFWDDAPHVLAGRDLKGGGTWMGVSRSGRIAALTNYREWPGYDPEAPSRGALVADFLTGDAAPQAYLEALAPTADAYNGFNLIVGTATDLWYFSNREEEVRALAPGLYGLSNHLLDTPWPKVVRGKAALAHALQQDRPDPEVLLALLRDTTCAPEGELPETGVGLEKERMLSPMFITSPSYGTRLSTVLLADAEGTLTFVEQTHAVGGAEAGTQSYEIQSQPAELADV